MGALALRLKKPLVGLYSSFLFDADGSAERLDERRRHGRDRVCLRGFLRLPLCR
jgi:hypothetical protein